MQIPCVAHDKTEKNNSDIGYGELDWRFVKIWIDDHKIELRVAFMSNGV